MMQSGWGLLPEAKKLVEKDPSLLLPEYRDKFRNEIKSIYDRAHAVFVTLDDRQLAFAKMVATHEDDLPRA
jgi:hypothetical protein